MKLHRLNTYYIIVGDFNAKHSLWYNATYNARVYQITKWLDTNEIKYKTKLYGTKEPTYPRSGSYLDICFIDARLRILSSNFQ